MSGSVRPQRRQPTRLSCPWDSPDKNTGVGCHVLLQCMKVKSESEVAQLCLTPSNSMDCSLPGSSVHGICQARVLEWVAIAFSDRPQWTMLIGPWLAHHTSLHPQQGISAGAPEGFSRIWPELLCAAIHGVTKSQTRPSDWTELIISFILFLLPNSVSAAGLRIRAGERQHGLSGTWLCVVSYRHGWSMALA